MMDKLKQYYIDTQLVIDKLYQKCLNSYNDTEHTHYRSEYMQGMITGIDIVQQKMEHEFFKVMERDNGG